MPTCIIHIGTEKTGTTFLQNWLYENFKKLQKQGVSLTRTAGSPSNRKLVAFLQENLDDYHKENGISDPLTRDLFFDGFEKQFTREIETLLRRYDTILLTSEHFHSRFRTDTSISKLRELLAPYFTEFRIVCYFREQSQVRTSLYSTTLTVQNTVSLEDFQDDIDPSSDYYNYLTFFQKWERGFGAAALRLRLYRPDAFFGDDLRLDFMQAALPHVKPGKLTFNQTLSNRSVTQSMARLFRTINQTRPRFVGGAIDPTPMAFRQAVRRQDFLKKGAPLIDDRQRDTFNTFNDSNVQFFGRFFGAFENLFPRPKDQVTQDPNQAYTLSDLEDLLRTLLSTPNLLVLTEADIELLLETIACLRRDHPDQARLSQGLAKIAKTARPNDKPLAKRLKQHR